MFRLKICVCKQHPSSYLLRYFQPRVDMSKLRIGAISGHIYILFVMESNQVDHLCVNEYLLCIIYIKALEMLVAPRISECFDLPWSALVCYSLLTSSFAPFGRSGRYVCLHHPASPFFSFFWLFIFFVGYLFFRCYYLFVCLFVWLVCLFSLLV